MKTTVLILLAVMAINFKGISQKTKEVVTENKPQREYMIRGDLSSFIAMYNFFDRVEESLKRHSDLPSNKMTVINDTLEIVRNIIIAQIESQYSQYLKEDSVINANLKKDSTIKK